MQRILAICAFAILGSLSAGAQVKKVGGAAGNPEELERLQAEALKNNHDIRVAEAKFRLAAAEHARTEAAVLARVEAASAEVENAAAGVKEADLRYRRALRLRGHGISDEELAVSKATFDRLTAELGLAEIRMSILLGRTKGNAKAPEPEKEKREQVEKYRAEALATNPELRVAEVKLRLAAASFDRARTELLGRVWIAHAELVFAEAGFAEARLQFSRATTRYKAKVISEEEFNALVSALAKAEQLKHAAEARLHTVVGRARKPSNDPKYTPHGWE